MPIAYIVDHDRNLVIETWTGDVTRAELAAHWQTLLTDPAALAVRRTVVDLRQSTPLINGRDISDLIAGIVMPHLGNRHWITALVVDKPVMFGISRQYQALAERYSRDAIFHNIDDALAWMQGQGPSD